MMRCAVALAGVFLAASSYAADDPMQTRHDTYCIACHDTQVYTRQSRTANDYEELRTQVDRWQSNLSLNWSQEEVDNMATWLARRYYKIECPHGC